MSLLTICRNAAIEINIAQPAVVIGSGAPEVQSLLRYANKVGNMMARAFPWQAIRREQVFTAAAANEQPSALPDDFSYFVPDCMWNRSTSQQITGPISAQEHAARVAALNSDSGYPKFSYRGNVILLLPAPSGGNSIAFEYASMEWASTADGATKKTAFGVDTDISLIDEELITLGVIYEFLKQASLPAAGDALADYRSRFEMLSAAEVTSAATLTVGDIFGSGRHYSGVVSPDLAGLFYGA